VRLTEPRVAAHKTTTPHELTTGGIGDPRQSFSTSLSRQRILVLSHRRPTCYMAKQPSEMRVSRRRAFLIPAPRHDGPDSKSRSSQRDAFMALAIGIAPSLYLPITRSLIRRHASYVRPQVHLSHCHWMLCIQRFSPYPSGGCGDSGHDARKA
jgi:hypothetical protein